MVRAHGRFPLFFFNADFSNISLTGLHLQRHPRFVWSLRLFSFWMLLSHSKISRVVEVLFIIISFLINNLAESLLTKCLTKLIPVLHILSSDSTKVDLAFHLIRISWILGSTKSTRSYEQISVFESKLEDNHQFVNCFLLHAYFQSHHFHQLQQQIL